MAKTVDLYIDQGADFAAVLPSVTAADGTPKNLTGYTGLTQDNSTVGPNTIGCQIRRGYATLDAVVLNVAVSNPATGEITLSLPKAETVGLTPTRYVYDVIMTDENNNTTRIFEGLAVVNPGVTSKPNTTLLTPYVPDDWGGL